MEYGTTITISTQFWAVHRWQEAPDAVAFLRAWHRHLFKVEVELEVKHEGRELEFFMVKEEVERFIRSEFEGKEHEESCEGFARILLERLETLYPGRPYSVSVSEDGENGATIRVRRE